MDFSEIFRIVNLATAVFIILGGVCQFFPKINPTAYTKGIRQNVIIAVYLFIFGAGTALLEFQIPPIVGRYANFMFSFVGRGVFYIFLGCIISGDNWWKTACGVIVVAIGVAYVALEYVPSIEPPANMRDADASSWGAEQI